MIISAYNICPNKNMANLAWAGCRTVLFERDSITFTHATSQADITSILVINADAWCVHFSTVSNLQRMCSIISRPQLVIH